MLRKCRYLLLGMSSPRRNSDGLEDTSRNCSVRPIASCILCIQAYRKMWASEFISTVLVPSNEIFMPKRTSSLSCNNTWERLRVNNSAREMACSSIGRKKKNVNAFRRGSLECRRHLASILFLAVV